MVFVTGASGLIGSFICRKLLEEGYAVRALKRSTTDLYLVDDIKEQVHWIEGDLLNVAEIDSYLQGIQQVVHCAAYVSFDKREEELIYQTNIEGTANLVNAAINQHIDFFMHVSSVASIGKDKNEEVSTEETLWTEDDNISAYAKSKHLSEVEVWRGWAEGLNTVIINPSLVLGPGRWNKSSTQVFKYVYEENRFYTSGIANYVDVRDVAEVTVRLLNQGLGGERFIVNAGSVTYKTLFDTIAEAMQKAPPRFEVGDSLISMAIAFEKTKNMLLGTKPMLTEELKSASKNRHVYSNEKVKEAVGIRFRALGETVHWVCGQLMNRKTG